jgi:hypothetical protein
MLLLAVMHDIVPKDSYPRVLAMLVDGEPWCGKVRIGKRTNRYRNDPGYTSIHVGDRRSTVCAKAICGFASTIGNTLVGADTARYRNCLIRKPRLCRKRAPCAPLALEAMAYRDPHRFPFAANRDSAAAALSDTGHGLGDGAPTTSSMC